MKSYVFISRGPRNYLQATFFTHHVCKPSQDVHDMEAVHRNMMLALTHTQQPRCEIDADTLRCTEDMNVQVQEAPWDLREIHNQACKSICGMAVLLHRSSAAPILQTYINAYLLWFSCMRAVLKEEHQQRDHPKHGFAQYMQRIPLRKLTVILPTVCFWVSVKCSDSLPIRTQDVAKIVVALHQERGDQHLLEYKLQDLRHTEDAMLQLLDFDILKNQRQIDKMEDTIRAHFGEAYESQQAQAQIVHIVFQMFREVADKMD